MGGRPELRCADSVEFGKRTRQRSARRVLTHQQLWNGNREQLSVLSPRSLMRLWNEWPL